MQNPNVESLLELPLMELLSFANRVRKECVSSSRVHLCSIVNAKSGLCGEDCRFCAQSSRHSAQIAAYPLKKAEEIVESARRARDMGAERLGIVTSGGSVTKWELKRIAGAISEIRNSVGIEACASLGKLNKDELLMLKNAGLSRYHHNIETSAAYFSRIVTTHKFQDRVNTIEAAQRAGLEVCSGGIIGIGENWRDRIEMALTLKKLNVNHVPINILVPIKGTPSETLTPISCVDVIKTICIFRIILKDKAIKIVAGRESILKDFQALAFMAGANGMLIGGYLTIKGRAPSEDRKLAEEIKRIWME